MNDGFKFPSLRFETQQIRLITTASFAYYAISYFEASEDNTQSAVAGSTSKKVSIRDSSLQHLGYLLQYRRRNLPSEHNGLTWKEALQLSSKSMCSRMHDKIFGLLGIVRIPLSFQADYTVELLELSNNVLNREIEEDPDARSAMVQSMGPPILAHTREASLLADVLKLNLSHTEIHEIVGNAYLRIGRWEHLESFLPALFGGPPSSPWDHERAHTADVTSALGIAPVAYTVCELKCPEPVDPQLAAAIGHHMKQVAQDLFGRSPSTRQGQGV